MLNRPTKISPEVDCNEKLMLEPRIRGKVRDTARRPELIVDRENKFRCSISLIVDNINLSDRYLKPKFVVETKE